MRLVRLMYKKKTAVRTSCRWSKPIMIRRILPLKLNSFQFTFGKNQFLIFPFSLHARKIKNMKLVPDTDPLRYMQVVEIYRSSNKCGEFDVLSI